MSTIYELVSLKGKVSIITGAASGIGKAIALRFAEAGSQLELIDIDFKGLENLRKEITGKFNVKVNVYNADLSRKEEIDALWSKWKDSPPDILVNNVGIYPFKKFLELDEEYVIKVLRVNMFSALWMSQYMIRYREGRGGVIINVGSIEAILPFKEDLTHYSISKAGVISLTRSLAREYGGKGFRVNALVPGGIMTEGVIKMAVEMGADLEKEGVEYLKRVPLGRFGEPDEVARVALFLATELSSYVNGAIIPVDGGFLSS